MTTQRDRRQVFGEVAEAYDDVRPGYPAQVLDLIVAYAGRVPAAVVESGAGTGKGTALLRTLGVPLTCVEPDPAMAAVLARRFADDDLVSVVVSRFEDWTPPPGGVELLASAQAWHWVDPAARTGLAAAALAPGGVFAVFGHEFGFADDGLREAMDDVYERVAPEISDRVDRAHHVQPADSFDPDELSGGGLFGDVRMEEVVTVLPYGTSRYLTLLTTFSRHRLLPEPRRAALHRALAEVIDARGGVVEQKLTTVVCLTRRIG
ncbi:methyltransferase type 11 [Catellatospora sp. TT07R-123]|uniref:methyltransferase domain-containing protein n=1 Tax=Catellatospora sp. TT07R-123 TaxID=2733863 RepID=UPI001B2554E0|nr:methyltransferase domain-containing protein [Catellatospora sp. TT07R-123]GHJ47358.1 methyltransferase type 11 [Catellatospora sp. TT07R-123]